MDRSFAVFLIIYSKMALGGWSTLMILPIPKLIRLNIAQVLVLCWVLDILLWEGNWMNDHAFDISFAETLAES